MIRSFYRALVLVCLLSEIAVADVTREEVSAELKALAPTVESGNLDDPGPELAARIKRILDNADVALPAISEAIRSTDELLREVGWWFLDRLATPSRCREIERVTLPLLEGAPAIETRARVTQLLVIVGSPKAAHITKQLLDDAAFSKNEQIELLRTVARSLTEEVIDTFREERRARDSILTPELRAEFDTKLRNFDALLPTVKAEVPDAEKRRIVLLHLERASELKLAEPHDPVRAEHARALVAAVTPAVAEKLVKSLAAIDKRPEAQASLERLAKLIPKP